MACAGSMLPSGSVRDGLCSFIGRRCRGHLNLRGGLLMNSIDQLENLAVGARSQILEDSVDQGQGQLDFLVTHLDTPSIAEKGQQ